MHRALRRQYEKRPNGRFFLFCAAEYRLRKTLPAICVQIAGRVARSCRPRRCNALDASESKRIGTSHASQHLLLMFVDQEMRDEQRHIAEGKWKQLVGEADARGATGSPIDGRRGPKAAPDRLAGADPGERYGKSREGRRARMCGRFFDQQPRF